METATRKKIVLLFDYYSEDSKKLHKSFELANIDCDVVVIEDDGYLPDSTISLYSYFLDEFSLYDTYLGRARYFNQIDIPEYWEIEASALGGQVHDLNKKRAKMYFADRENKRQVKVVEWFDETGVVRLSEHYNKYGVLYAKTSFNSKGERVNKIYYSSNKREVIYENFVTGAIILNHKGEERIFSNKIEFVTYFMTINGYDDYKVYYNSLWYSFFVSEQLNSRGEEKTDILFWQENERDDIPGNMKAILEGTAARTQYIMVQKKAAYDKLIGLGAPEHVLRLKGFIYPFERENEYRKNILIATNSDQVEHIEDLVRALSNVKFNIVAITTMSEVLLSLGKYDNVVLYPNIKMSTLDELYKECDYYLDINHHDVICDSIYRAFINNMAILSFTNTRHSKAFIADRNDYASDDWMKMAEDISNMVENQSETERRIKEQRKNALAESGNSYRIFS